MIELFFNSNQKVSISYNGLSDLWWDLPSSFYILIKTMFDLSPASTEPEETASRIQLNKEPSLPRIEQWILMHHLTFHRTLGNCTELRTNSHCRTCWTPSAGSTPPTPSPAPSGRGLEWTWLILVLIRPWTRMRGDTSDIISGSASASSSRSSLPVCCDLIVVLFLL